MARLGYKMIIVETIFILVVIKIINASLCLCLLPLQALTADPIKRKFVIKIVQDFGKNIE